MLPLHRRCGFCITFLCYRNLLSDLLYTSQADVLLGLHGDSMYWGFFMAKHSSVVEIRPRGFAGPQANQHMKVSAAFLACRQLCVCGGRHLQECMSRCGLSNSSINDRH